MSPPLAHFPRPSHSTWLLSTLLVALVCLVPQDALANKTAKPKVSRTSKKATKLFRASHYERNATYAPIRNVKGEVVGKGKASHIGNAPSTSIATSLAASHLQKATGKSWEVTSTQITSNANPELHPITGNATVVVEAKSTNKLGLSKKRQLIVEIAPNGKAAIVSERANSRAAKLYYALRNKQQSAQRKIADFTNSAHVRKALREAGGGAILFLALLGAEAISPGQGGTMLPAGLAIGSLTSINTMIMSEYGMNRRSEARLQAFTTLMHKIDGEIRAGKSVSVDGAFARYKKSLRSVNLQGKVSKNVQAPSREVFVEALRAWEIHRAQTPSFQ